MKNFYRAAAVIDSIRDYYEEMEDTFRQLWLALQPHPELYR